LLRAYHDEEWGVPQYDSRALWEVLMLDGFQAGLSWTIILRKREVFRKAFHNFDPERWRASVKPMWRARAGTLAMQLLLSVRRL
jgi:3-methyladenine DNA glycosylase Tag